MEHGANPNVVDKNTFAPLHLASHFGHLKVNFWYLYYLYFYFSSLFFLPLAIYLGCWRTFESWCSSWFGNSKCRYPISSCYIPKPYWNCFNSSWKVLIYLFIFFCNFHIQKKKNKKKNKHQNRYNVNVNALDKDLCTPLHYCCRKGYLSLASFLLTHSANPNAKNVYEDTPLHTLVFEFWRIFYFVLIH